MQQPRLVILDMAGTTVEDRGEVPAAFEAALARQGITTTPAQINAVRGASKRQAIQELIPPGAERQTRVEAAYADFKRLLAERFTTGARPIPGTLETFEWLRQAGVKIALNTGFDRDTVNLLLESLKWGSDVIDAVVCGDDVPCGRPAPYLIFRCMQATRTTSVHRVAVAGDTTLDLEAGYNAGARWNIGVLSGAHSREQLEQQPHTHILASVRELTEVFMACG